MNEDATQQALLSEVQKLRRTTRRIFWLFLILGTVSILWMPLAPRPGRDEPGWDKVQAAMRRGDSAAALRLSLLLVDRQPSYYYGHAYLGLIYLTMNDLANAEAEYLRAYQLFPSEENEKNLAAVRKRLTNEPPVRLTSPNTGPQ